MRNNYDEAFSEPTSTTLSRWKRSIKESSLDELEEFIRTYAFAGKRIKLVEPNLETKPEHEHVPDHEPTKPKEQIRYFNYESLKPEDIEYSKDNNFNDLDVHDMDDFRSILNIYKDDRDTAEEMRKNYDIFFAKPTLSILKKWKETIEESSRDGLEEYIRTYEFIGKRKIRR